MTKGNPTNTPSPTDEDREQVRDMLERRRKDAEAQGGSAEIAVEEIDELKSRLESLLSDRAKLEAALDYLRSARSNIVAAKGLSALTYLDDAVESLRAALNRSTDRPT